MLGGATPGVHPAFSKYYMRTVRMSSSDALVQTCKDMGYHVEFLVNFDVILDRAVSFHDQPIIWGVGKLGYKNNSEYVTVNKHKRFKLGELLNANR